MFWSTSRSRGLRNCRYVPFCNVFLLQPLQASIGLESTKELFLSAIHFHGNPLAQFLTGLPFSSCSHWTVSLIWDWECGPCILAIYSQTTTSPLSKLLSVSAVGDSATTSKSKETWEQDHDVEHYQIHWRDFQRNCLHISQYFDEFCIRLYIRWFELNVWTPLSY